MSNRTRPAPSLAKVAATALPYLSRPWHRLASFLVILGSLAAVTAAMPGIDMLSSFSLSECHTYPVLMIWTDGARK